MIAEIRLVKVVPSKDTHSCERAHHELELGFITLARKQCEVTIETSDDRLKHLTS